MSVIIGHASLGLPCGTMRCLLCWVGGWGLLPWLCLGIAWPFACASVKAGYVLTGLWIFWLGVNWFLLVCKLRNWYLAVCGFLLLMFSGSWYNKIFWQWIFLAVAICGDFVWNALLEQSFRYLLEVGYKQLDFQSMDIQWNFLTDAVHVNSSMCDQKIFFVFVSIWLLQGWENLGRLGRFASSTDWTRV